MDTEPIRQDIDAIRNSMTDKMEQIESRVRGTVETTVSSVKQTFDIKGQVAERPWAAFGLSVLAGVALGSLGDSSRPSAPSYPAYRGEPMRYYQEPKSWTPTSHSESSREPEQQPTTQGTQAPSATGSHQASSESMRAAMQGSSQGSGLLETLSSQFSDEIGALKTAAIAAAMNAVRDMLQQNLPKFADEYQRAHDERSSRYAQGDSPRNIDGESSMFERSVGADSVATYNATGVPNDQPATYHERGPGSATVDEPPYSSSVGNATKDQVRTTASANPFQRSEDLV